MNLELKAMRYCCSHCLYFNMFLSSKDLEIPHLCVSLGIFFLKKFLSIFSRYKVGEENLGSPFVQLEVEENSVATSSEELSEMGLHRVQCILHLVETWIESPVRRSLCPLENKISLWWPSHWFSMSSQPTRVGSCACSLCGIKFCWSSLWLLALPSFTSECHHLELNLSRIIGMWFCFSLAQILPQGLFSLSSIYATSENIHRPLLFSLFISQSLKKKKESCHKNKLCLHFLVGWDHPEAPRSFWTFS